MDADKDGLLSSSDLQAAFAAHGKNIGGGETQAMLDEVDGPMNFTQMVTLFASKMAGGSDDDDVILASFECFENDGKIDADTFRHSLMTFGVKFSASEVDDAFAEMKIDDGQIDAAHLKGLMALNRRKINFQFPANPIYGGNSIRNIDQSFGQGAKIKFFIKLKHSEWLAAKDPINGVTRQSTRGDCNNQAGSVE